MCLVDIEVNLRVWWSYKFYHQAVKPYLLYFKHPHVRFAECFGFWSTSGLSSQTTYPGLSAPEPSWETSPRPHRGPLSYSLLCCFHNSSPGINTSVFIQKTYSTHQRIHKMKNIVITSICYTEDTAITGKTTNQNYCNFNCNLALLLLLLLLLLSKSSRLSWHQPKFQRCRPCQS